MLRYALIYFATFMLVCGKHNPNKKFVALNLYPRSKDKRYFIAFVSNKKFLYIPAVELNVVTARRCKKSTHFVVLDYVKAVEVNVIKRSKSRRAKKEDNLDKLKQVMAHVLLVDLLKNIQKLKKTDPTFKKFDMLNGPCLGANLVPPHGVQNLPKPYEGDNNYGTPPNFKKTFAQKPLGPSKYEQPSEPSKYVKRPLPSERPYSTPEEASAQKPFESSKYEPYGTSSNFEESYEQIPPQPSKNLKVTVPSETFPKYEQPNYGTSPGFAQKTLELPKYEQPNYGPYTSSNFEESYAQIPPQPSKNVKVAVPSETLPKYEQPNYGTSPGFAQKTLEQPNYEEAFAQKPYYEPYTTYYEGTPERYYTPYPTTLQKPYYGPYNPTTSKPYYQSRILQRPYNVLTTTKRPYYKSYNAPVATTKSSYYQKNVKQGTYYTPPTSKGYKPSTTFSRYVKTTKSFGSSGGKSRPLSTSTISTKQQIFKASSVSTLGTYKLNKQRSTNRPRTSYPNRTKSVFKDYMQQLYLELVVVLLVQIM